ncbi:MAG: DUF4423 domain-containing protein, partial [Bdellovibrionales bacterium]|nr:DUF4423 domain-containing protein [Bdellovibrionales bacterium]
LQWLSQRLGLDPITVREAWHRLLRLGFIKKAHSANFQRTDSGTETPGEVTNISLRKSHLQDLKLIEEALLELPVELRSTTSVTLSMELSDLAKAKRLIDEFHDRFLELMESKAGDEVYRMSISLFPLTKVEKQ